MPAGRPEDAALLENFRTYDLNSSGALSLSEVQRMMQDLGYQADSPEQHTQGETNPLHGL